MNAKCPRCGYNQQVMSMRTNDQYFVTCGYCDLEFWVDADNVVNK